MANIRPLITVGSGDQAGPVPLAQPVQVDEEPTIDLREDPDSSVGEPAPAAPRQQPTGSSAGGSDLLNINTATVQELQTLPGIGRTKAEAIVEYRNTNGPFTATEQLDNVPGIGPSTLANILPLVTVE
ncbi:MAG: ComEA family DNA-binding protein [Bradymonadales bacterium]|nr:ComEA family DNA-binding protein [Bradymonadales bacterium]